MGLDAMKTGVHILKGLNFSIKTCYRLVRYHPSILGIMLIFYLLHRFLPSVFRFLLHSSPVFICTSILLATLMALGDRDPPKVEEKLQRRYSRRTRVKKDDCVIEEKEITSVRTLGRKMIDIKEEVETASVAEGNKGKARGRRVSFSPIHDYGFISKIDDQPKEIHGRNEINRDEKPLIQGVSIADEDVKGEISKPVDEISDSHSKDCLKEHDENVESSKSVSDHTESSSSKASIATTNPVIDEPHPVPDSQPPQPVLISINEFDGAPEESNDCSEESEAEKNEGEDTESDGTKTAVSWTEDDEKNLMDLGCSEMERNQRLESLMARRRARKVMRREADKNLIDFDCNDAPYQIAPLSIIKNKTFAQPYIENEIEGMPPIPGSAPSVLIPRKNPFDLPYDPQEEKPNLTGDSFSQEFMTVLQKDIFCRHESFCLGSTSVSGGLKQDKGDARISVFFIPEDIASSSGQRQLSDTSDSVSSSVPETELQSSVAEQEEQKKVIEQEGELISNIDHSPHYVEEISQPPEVDLVENYQEETIDADYSKVEINLPNTSEAYINPDVVEEKFSGLNSSSSSPSSEMNEKFLHEDTEGVVGSQNIKRTSEGLSVSGKNSNLKNGVAAVDYSIPSAIEKRTIDESLFCVDKGVVLTSFPSLSSFPSIASDLQVEVSEVGSPPLSTERTISLTDGEGFQYNESVKSDISSGSEGHWTASSGLCAVDETESKSKEVTEISESDVIKAGLLGANDDSDEPMVIEPAFELLRIDSNSTSSPMKEPTEGQINQIPASIVEPVMNVGDHQFDLEKVDPITSSSSPAQILVEKSIVQPLPGDGLQHSTSSQMKELTEEPTNQIQASSAEPEMNVGVCQLDSEEKVGPIASSSSPAQIVVERSTVEPSSSNGLQDSTLEHSINQIPASIAEPEISLGVCQLDLKEKVDPIASTSLPSQVMVEKLMVQPPPSDGLQHSTSSQMKEPREEDAVNQIPSSSAEPEINVGVLQLDHPEEVDPTASGSLPAKHLFENSMVQPPSNDAVQHSTSSEMKERTEEGAINQVPASSAEPEMNIGLHQLDSEKLDPIASSSLPAKHLFENSMVQLPSNDAVQHSTSSQTKEPTEGGPIRQILASSAEHLFEMNVRDEQLDSEKVEPVTSTSLLAEHLFENLMVQLLPDDGLQYSTSSQIKEPTEEVVISQIPASSGEPETNVKVHRLDSLEKLDPIAASSSPVQLLAEKVTSQQSLNGDLHETQSTLTVQPSSNSDIHEVTQVSSMVHPSPSGGLHGERQISLMVQESLNGDLREVTQINTMVQPSPNGDIHEETQVSSMMHPSPDGDLHEETHVSEMVQPSLIGDLHEETQTSSMVQPSPNGDCHEVSQEPSIMSTEEAGNPVPVAHNKEKPKSSIEDVADISGKSSQDEVTLNLSETKATEGNVNNVNKPVVVGDKDKPKPLSIEEVSDKSVERKTTVNSPQKLLSESGVSSDIRPTGIQKQDSEADHHVDKKINSINRSSTYPKDVPEQEVLETPMVSQEESSHVKSPQQQYIMENEGLKSLLR